MNGNTPPAPAPGQNPTPDPVVPPAAPPAPPAPPTPPVVPDDKAARDAAFAEQRRRADAAEAEAQQLRDREAQRERDEAEARGEHEKIAAQEKARADAAEAEVERIKTEAKVRDLASGLNFRNPADALALLPADVDRKDDAALTAALTQLATDRDYLVATPPPPSPAPSGSPIGGTPPAEPTHQDVTPEQLRQMSTAEVSRLPQAVIDKALGRT